MVASSLRTATYIHRVIEYAPALILMALSYGYKSSNGPGSHLGLFLVIIWARYCMQILDKIGLLETIFGCEMELV